MKSPRETAAAPRRTRTFFSTLWTSCKFSALLATLRTVQAVCLCVVGVLLLGAAHPTGQIAFVSGTEQDDLCVCVMDVETGVVARVGPGCLDGAPVWSPDGSWLAFPTRHGDGMGICLCRSDGSDVRRPAHAHPWNRRPRWSPDGASVAYDAIDEGRLDPPRIMVYGLASGVETQWGGDKTGLMRPVWMPNLKILYALRPDQSIEWDSGQTKSMTGLDWLKGESALLAIGIVGKPGKFTTDIFVVTDDTAAPLPEWVLPSRGAYVEWAAEPSPNGGSIAFESNDGGDREIFCYTRDRAVDVSNHRAGDWNPVWSPDSEWLAFESFRDGRRGIYRVYGETARISPVAVSPDADNWSPSWSPDGKWLAFVSDRTGDPEIFITDVHGKNVVQLTNHPGPDYAPAWRPKGKK